MKIICPSIVKIRLFNSSDSEQDENMLHRTDVEVSITDEELKICNELNSIRYSHRHNFTQVFNQYQKLFQMILS